MKGQYQFAQRWCICWELKWFVKGWLWEGSERRLMNQVTFHWRDRSLAGLQEDEALAIGAGATTSRSWWMSFIALRFSVCLSLLLYYLSFSYQDVAAYNQQSLCISTYERHWLRLLSYLSLHLNFPVIIYIHWWCITFFLQFTLRHRGLLRIFLLLNRFLLSTLSFSSYSDRIIVTTFSLPLHPHLRHELNCSMSIQIIAHEYFLLDYLHNELVI